jgi:hypothetical protein
MIFITLFFKLVLNSYVSPCFSEDILADYYGSSLRNPIDQSPDYDISYRVDVINRFSPPPTGVKPKFIELGPSTFGEFQKRIGESFYYLGIEPSGAFGSEWKKTEDIKDVNLADIVAHYFVLEHVPNPLKFLKECNRLLKMSGTMIVEVPNIAIYPTDPVALYLYEHQSHFSSKTLEYLASKAGFTLVEYSDKSSRSFGMLAVFRKIHEFSTSNAPALLDMPAEYQINRNFFNLGLAEVEYFKNSIMHAKDFINQSMRDLIILWGGNQSLIDFLELAYPNSNLPDSLIFIDSDPRKRNLLLDYDKRFDKTIFTPPECIDAINKSSKLIIFTRRHKQAILDQIISLSGKLYNHADVLTVDINP